ncbi:MAG: dTDP-4-dehydrorhamnose 3,5-epimerase [Gammaproteobacteria bacterium]|nr:MAG: dTDP-4-dehydrorhamnose 3,5-epimerase [Gammaproteobacteria bacterium]
MKVSETSLDGVLLIEPKSFSDNRGFFIETWHHERYRKVLGVDHEFVQDNHSRSTFGVLRGLHYQLEHPQGKLVRVSAGSVFDVAVDIRKGSPTFGKWYGVELSDQNFRQLWIPPGLAHGFCVLSDMADFHYKCTDYYCPDCEYGIAWNDPGLNINWPLDNPVLSKKDQLYPMLHQVKGGHLPAWES